MKGFSEGIAGSFALVFVGGVPIHKVINAEFQRRNRRDRYLLVFVYGRCPLSGVCKCKVSSEKSTGPGFVGVRIWDVSSYERF